MKKFERKAITDNIKKYTYCGNDDDTITITEWENGEGWDIDFNYVSGYERHFSISYNELDAIQYLIKRLDYKD
jgi:hypothetical protein